MSGDVSFAISVSLVKVCVYHVGRLVWWEGGGPRWAEMNRGEVSESRYGVFEISFLVLQIGVADVVQLPVVLEKFSAGGGLIRPITPLHRAAFAGEALETEGSS